MPEDDQELIGGKYEIVEKLREGGMGAIFKARHRFLEEVRVIKVLRPQLARDATIQARFRQEAEVALSLRHPNIAHLFEFSVADPENAYIVMEYIDGVTLEEMLDSTGIPSLGLGVEIARQCLEALRYLHGQGFIHRDVAADNLMLTTGLDDRPVVKLIDLGIVKGLGVSSDLTQTGTFMGKARYTAPEQFSGAGASELDQRADVYSFGVLFYELLTGRSPVSGKDFSQILAGHLFHPPLAFSESDPEGRIPEGLRKLVLRALEKDPNRRLPSAGEFLEGLAPFLEPVERQQQEFSNAFKTTTGLVMDGGAEPAPPATEDEAEAARRAEAAKMVRAAQSKIEESRPEVSPAGTALPAPAAPASRAPRPAPAPARPAAAGRWLAAAAGLAALAALVVWLLLSMR